MAEVDVFVEIASTLFGGDYDDRTDDRVTVKENKKGEWYWTRSAENGEKICGSLEGYDNLRHAVKMALLLNNDLELDHFGIFTAEA